MSAWLTLPSPELRCCCMHASRCCTCYAQQFSRLPGGIRFLVMPSGLLHPNLELLHYLNSALRS